MMEVLVEMEWTQICYLRLFFAGNETLYGAPENILCSGVTKQHGNKI